MGRFIDRTGQTFGRLIIIKREANTTNKHGTQANWLCQCNCGSKPFIVSAGRLTSGNTKSCGCLHKEVVSQIQTIDLTGQQFGRLTVICKANNADNKIRWICRCECGTEKSIQGNELRIGDTQSCGCLQKDNTSKRFTKNLIGQQFGLLRVLERSGTAKYPNSKSSRVIWKCLCECGIEKDVLSGSLLSGRVQSCGCVKSFGELHIAKILQLHNIPFVKEYTFDNLKSNKGRKLRFDFAIVEYDKIKYLIEFDGEDHYEPRQRSKLKEFERRKLNDNLKDQYCIENNIPLIRIPYWERCNLNFNMIKLETSPYLING